MRRLTRLTYAFSKKIENFEAAVALHFAYYNFCRMHGSFENDSGNESGHRKEVVDGRRLS
jgi:hypothetical protein